MDKLGRERRGVVDKVGGCLICLRVSVVARSSRGSSDEGIHRSGTRNTTAQTATLDEIRMTDDDTRTLTFDDEGALDTFIAMTDLTSEEVDELRENVEQFGYGTPVPHPEDT